MYEIVDKRKLNDNVVLMEIKAPLISKKCKAGQFVILRVSKLGERIPLTIYKKNKTKKTISIIFQIVGETTYLLNLLEIGDCLEDLTGPLGKETKLNDLNKVLIVGGGVGSAICYPILESLKEKGALVDVILGFRNNDLVILENEFKEIADSLVIMTNDGSYGKKGLVTEEVKNKLENKYDEVIVIGPLPMMKYVSLLTKEYNIKTIVSMNPIMIDGTGMCGGCRLIVDGKMKFACVDGPDFDGHKVDFDDAIQRSKMYEKKERSRYCNLLKEVNK